MAFAKNKDVNVAFVVGACTMDGVKDNGAGLGAVYWQKTHIYFGTQDKDAVGYANAMAKGPPYTYQANVDRMEPSTNNGSQCFTLAGGNMLGYRVRSNVAVIPIRPSH